MTTTMLNRPDEAREMYEKLQSHPNPRVSKKARQFMFSFQVISDGGLLINLFGMTSNIILFVFQ